jgi:hypothetical protein
VADVRVTSVFVAGSGNAVALAFLIQLILPLYGDVTIVEMMAEDMDRRWWGSYAKDLAVRFGQEELVVRAIAFEALSGNRATG